LQISAALAHRLQEAAELRGVSLKHFLVETALKEANRIVGREKVARNDAPANDAEESA